MKRILFLILSPLVLVGMHSCGSMMADNQEVKGAFDYRDVYLPDYNNKTNSELNLNNIDDDWGIWGHNLGVVLPENPSLQAYAKINGGSNDNQFCFSSNKLYDYIVSYIKNNYLFQDSVRFAILPNDNDLVCLCTECTRIGNTRGDASPAVFYLIERLAKKFPQHLFFTSYYSTTKSLPDKVLPPNAGVLVSAIDYPLTAGETPKEKEFLKLLKRWNEKTNEIYVWDYINNFDDYFTPSPIFGIMQRRLKLYRDAGVDGVFLNGSGNDYSTFAKLKKAVLSQLLINPDLDWEELLRKYAVEYYPTAGNDIADFIVLQETMIEGTGKAIPEYEGVNEIRKIYLPEQGFVDFYNKLIQHKKNAAPEERAELETMLDAMSFTMLELKRISGDMSGTEILKDRVKRLKGKDILYYNEGAWSVDEYLQNYEFMEKEAKEAAPKNLLKDVKLRPLTALDEDYQDISIITDGLVGIPSNYHDGNLISSADPAFSLSIPRQEGMKKLRVWMVYNPGFKIGLPEEVYITTDGLKSARLTPEKPVGGSGHSYLDFNVPEGSGDVILTLVKNPDVKTMAIDEIEAFNE